MQEAHRSEVVMLEDKQAMLSNNNAHFESLFQEALANAERETAAVHMSHDEACEQYNEDCESYSRVVDVMLVKMAEQKMELELVHSQMGDMARAQDDTQLYVSSLLGSVMGPGPVLDVGALANSVLTARGAVQQSLSVQNDLIPSIDQAASSVLTARGEEAGCQQPCPLCTRRSKYTLTPPQHATFQ
eukprot:gene532-1944_t